MCLRRTFLRLRTCTAMCPTPTFLLSRLAGQNYIHTLCPETSFRAKLPSASASPSPSFLWSFVLLPSTWCQSEYCFVWFFFFNFDYFYFYLSIFHPAYLCHLPVEVKILKSSVGYEPAEGSVVILTWMWTSVTCSRVENLRICSLVV